MKSESSSPDSVFLAHLRLVSASLFVLAAVGFYFVLRLEQGRAPNGEALLLLKMLEEIPKGVLAASAVAFLYDWLLKLETAKQTRQIVSGALQEFDLEAKADDIYVDFMKEVVLTPLEEGLLPGKDRYYRVSVHCRFYARYLGDKVRLALLTTRGPVKEVREDDSYVFYWLLDFWPATPPDARWLEAPSLKVNNVPWVRGEPVVRDNIIFVEFHKPQGWGRPPGTFVSYELDARLIESSETVIFYITRQTLRPVFRLDARGRGVRSISHHTTLELPAASWSEYVAGPEGEGTCQVFIPGRVSTSPSVFLTMR